LLLFMFSFLYAYEVIEYTDTFIDPNRDDREIEVEIFYPDGIPGEESFPVLIYGHGWLLNYNFYAQFTQELVSSGHIMAFPRTEEGLFPDHWDFALDIAFIAEEIQLENEDASSNLYNIVMPVAVAMGHSMGGGCSILATSENDIFSCLINFAAAETNPSAIEAALDVFCPSLIFSADDDNITPQESHQIPMYNNLSSELKYHINIFNETHLGLPGNEMIPDIIQPFISYIADNDYNAFLQFETSLDSLLTEGYLEYEFESNVNTKPALIPPVVGKLRNYPNPFSPKTAGSTRTRGTVISYQLSEMSEVNLAIFNLRGQHIKTLVDDIKIAGEHSIIWNGKDKNNHLVGPGVYLYQIKVTGDSLTRKMQIIN